MRTEHFRAQPNPPELPMPDADYNVAPTTDQPIIRQSWETGEQELILARWGLVPFFTQRPKTLVGIMRDQSAVAPHPPRPARPSQAARDLTAPESAPSLDRSPLTYRYPFHVADRSDHRLGTDSQRQ